MFQTKELRLLALQKKQLALKSDINRLRLISDWQQVRSGHGWLNEGLGLLKRHPIVATALATASGILATKALRRSGSIFSGIGRIGRMASMAVTAWRMVQKARQNHTGDQNVNPVEREPGRDRS